MSELTRQQKIQYNTWIRDAKTYEAQQLWKQALQYYTQASTIVPHTEKLIKKIKKIQVNKVSSMQLHGSYWHFIIVIICLLFRFLF